MSAPPVRRVRSSVTAGQARSRTLLFRSSDHYQITVGDSSDLQAARQSITFSVINSESEHHSFGYAVCCETNLTMI